MRRLLIQSATVTSRSTAGADVYGNTTYTTTVRGPFACRIDDLSSTEDTIDRETVRSLRRGFFMPEAALAADETVQVGSVTYRVMGDPMQRLGSTGVHHLEVMLEEVRP